MKNKVLLFSSRDLTGENSKDTIFKDALLRSSKNSHLADYFFEHNSEELNKLAILSSPIGQQAEKDKSSDSTNPNNPEESIVTLASEALKLLPEQQRTKDNPLFIALRQPNYPSLLAALKALTPDVQEKIKDYQKRLSDAETELNKQECNIKTRFEKQDFENDNYLNSHVINTGNSLSERQLTLKDRISIFSVMEKESEEDYCSVVAVLTLDTSDKRRKDNSYHWVDTLVMATIENIAQRKKNGFTNDDVFEIILMLHDKDLREYSNEAFLNVYKDRVQFFEYEDSNKGKLSFKVSLTLTVFNHTNSTYHNLIYTQRDASQLLKKTSQYCGDSSMISTLKALSEKFANWPDSFENWAENDINEWKTGISELITEVNDEKLNNLLLNNANTINLITDCKTLFSANKRLNELIKQLDV